MEGSAFGPSYRVCSYMGAASVWANEGFPISIDLFAGQAPLKARLRSQRKLFDFTPLDA